MNLEKLEETYLVIDNYDRLNWSLSSKVSQANEEKAREESIQHLLRHQLAQFNIDLDKHREELSKLKIEHDRLSKTYCRSISFLKRLQNYNIINNIRIEMKEQSMEKLQNQLVTLDFSIEELENDPTKKISDFSQYVRY